jgi:hypothetical protein
MVTMAIMDITDVMDIIHVIITENLNLRAKKDIVAKAHIGS